MKAILGVLSGIALIAFTYLCMTLSFAIHANSKHTALLLMNINASVVKLNETLDTLNAKKGTLDQLNDVIRDARMTVDHSDRLMTKQEKSIDQWNSQITATLGNVNTSVVALTSNENKITKSSVETLNATTESVKQIKPLIESLTAEASALQTTTQSINTLVSDPNIKSAVANVNVMTKNGDDATKDLKDYIHGILHPSWPKRIWGYTVDVAHAVL